MMQQGEGLSPARGPEVGPRDPHGGRRAPSSMSHPLIPHTHHVTCELPFNK